MNVETFPWPQTPTKAQIAEVAAAAVALRGLRREIMTQLGYSLRELYRTLDTPAPTPSAKPTSASTPPPAPPTPCPTPPTR